MRCGFLGFHAPSFSRPGFSKLHADLADIFPTPADAVRVSSLSLSSSEGYFYMEHNTRRSGKAIWNFHNTWIFCDICVSAVEQSMRPGTHFNTQGWKYVVDNFQQQTGIMYDKAQLKNRWEQLKIDWKLWKELKGRETGLGWNSSLETVDAPPDWWEAKIQVNKDYAKFKKKGIHPDIEAKNDIMFGNTVALGSDCYTPAIPPHVNDNMNVGSENDSAPVEDLENNSMNAESSQGNRSLNAEASQANRIASKRKGRNSKVSKLNDNFCKFMNLMAEFKDVMSPPGCGVKEVMTDLKNLTAISLEDEMFYFAMLLFEQKSKRELWNSLETPETRMRWLNFQYDLYKKFGRV